MCLLNSDILAFTKGRFPDSLDLSQNFLSFGPPGITLGMRLCSARYCTIASTSWRTLQKLPGRIREKVCTDLLSLADIPTMAGALGLAYYLQRSA
jgi:hypothetical protein